MPMINALFGIVQRYISWSPFNLIGVETAQIPLQLVSLPVELLTEVLKSITWKDLLRLRATCKFLSAATKTRAVWVHLVDQYISSKPCPPLLERPLIMHTSEELEQLLLLWNSVDIGWARDDGCAARERSIMVEPFKYVHLIRGGRWLLVTTKIGQVTYYDLDAETIEGVPLIPQQLHKPSSLVQVMMDIDIDSSSPTLSFRIALSIFDRFEPSEKATIQIWAVTLVLNGSHAVGLSAVRLALLHHRPMIVSVMAFSLLGPAVAFTAQCAELGLYTFVLNWDQVDRDSTNYVWRMLDLDMIKTEWLQLLCGDKLFVVNSFCMSLFDYSVIDETTHFLPNTPATCLWTTPLDDRFAWNISDYFFTPNTAQLFMSSLQCIRSITIKSEPFSDVPPPIIKVLDSDRVRFSPKLTSLGYTRAIVVDRDHVAWLVRYNSPDDVLCKPLLSVFPSVCQAPVMDDQSGRVIVPGLAGSQQITIVDFAVVFTS